MDVMTARCTGSRSTTWTRRSRARDVDAVPDRLCAGATVDGIGISATPGPVMLYALKLIDRARLKEMTQALVMGRRADLRTATAIAERFGDAGRAEACAATRARGSRRTRRRDIASCWRPRRYDFYVRPIAARARDRRRRSRRHRRSRATGWCARIAGENCYGRRQAADDRGMDGEGGDRARRRACPLLFGSCLRRADARLGGRGVRGQSARGAARRWRAKRGGRSSTGARSTSTSIVWSTVRPARRPTSR